MSARLDQMVSETTLQSVPGLAREFVSARPFKHVAIDNFFAPETARLLADHFPAFDEKLAMNENGVVGGKAVNQKVRGMGKPWAALDDLVKGEEFRQLISDITGIPSLLYDPHYFGGGTHENLQGQALDAHVDFNFHPITRQHRRLNIIIYLTEEWQDEWGGSIQLHKDPYLPPEQDEITVLTPLFNRCVIFETNEVSWHGFPRIELPEDKRHISRRSFALYYYTESRPQAELGPEHSTIYVEQHLPADFQAGITLDPATVQQVRNLVASRDQHLQRLYGNIKQLNTELNHLKEQMGLQAPPLVADESSGTPATGQVGADEAAAARSSAAFSDTMGAQASSGDELDANIRRRDERIRALEAHIAHLKQSTSWRITRPLRQLKRRLAGHKG